jgi:hypothetical protein
VRVELARAGSADAPTWAGVPGVTGATAVLYAPTTQPAGRIPAFVLGLDPEEMGATVPEARDAVQPLIGQRVDLIDGSAIPDEATQVAIKVFIPAKMPDSRLMTPTGVQVWLTISDEGGRTTRLPLQSPPFALDAWMTYTGDLSAAAGRKPLTITAIEYAPQVAVLPVVASAVFIDTLESLDAAGTATLLEDFEERRDGWQLRTDAQVFDLGPSRDVANTGERSLRAVFRVTRLASDPLPDAQAAGTATAQTFQAVRLVSVVEQPIPVVMSARMAKDLGEAARRERLPLEVGMTIKHTLAMPGGNITADLKIVGIVRAFPSLEERQHFLLMDRQTALQLINSRVTDEQQFRGANQFWLETASREPAPGLEAAIRGQTNAVNIAYAWDAYNVLLREPLPAALAGMLFAGFCVSLLLSLLDFAFYLAVTARRRSLGFAVLRSLGWDANNIWLLLVAEQAALVIPALLVGVGLGAVLAYVILPFLALVGGQTLQIPAWGLLFLVLALLGGFGALSFAAARWLRTLNVNQVLRLGEE